MIARFKVAKHFDIIIADGLFTYRRKTGAITAEARLDGIYVIRTSEPEDQLSPEDAVRSYKSLAPVVAWVERVFRTSEGVEILVRPIRHREERRVRAPIFLCLLAYYLEWHLRKAWASLLFDDGTLDRDRKARDPDRRTRDPSPPQLPPQG